MYSQTLKSLCRVLAFASVACFSVALAAQDSAKPAKNVPSQYSPSKWDIFAGYSYLAPKGTVNVPQPNGAIIPFDYSSVNVGGIVSVARYFNQYVGVQAEFGLHEWGVNKANQPPTGNPGTHGNNDGFTTITGGLIARYPTGEITPFVHALVGGALIDGPDHNPFRWGPDLTVGGGLDYETPFFDHHLAIRVFQADYEYMHADFGTGYAPPGGRANINAARLSAGIVFHVGTIAPPPPVTLSCVASPSSVFPGDPVTLTATPGMLNPKLNTVYSWSGDGVTGNGTTATVNTSTQAPGTYTVKCGVKEGKKGKEGLKPWESADATATYTVKQFEPPTISCSANPSTIKPDETSSIAAQGASPQNRPLTYTYSAASGSVSGTGNSATFSSTGAPAGPVAVTCNVSDDKGQTASADTTVTIEAPPPPPPPAPSPEQVRLEHRLALHSVFFPTNLPTKAHPDRGLLESQQTTVSTLATDFKSYLAFKPDARLIMTGHTDVRGPAKFNQELSERRVERVKAYLVEQGISASVIQTNAVGKEQQLTSDQVKSLVNGDQDLTDADKTKIQRNLSKIVLAQNRRVDIRLSTTGQESNQLYPFNAQDAETLLSEKAPVHESRKGAVQHHPKR